jgi:hypothetical protein
MIYTYQIGSDDDQLSNEDILTLDTVNSLPPDAKEYTAEQAAAMNPPDNFFAANFPVFHIYQDDNEALYFIPRDENKDLNTWKSPEEWKRLYPNHIFSVMNLSEWDDEAFDVQPVEALAVIIDGEDAEEKEIVFDTFRFNVLGWAPRMTAEFVARACFDEVTFVEDNTLQGWYD